MWREEVKVIFNSLDIDLIHGHIHNQSREKHKLACIYYVKIVHVLLDHISHACVISVSSNNIKYIFISSISANNAALGELILLAPFTNMV